MLLSLLCIHHDGSWLLWRLEAKNSNSRKLQSDLYQQFPRVALPGHSSLSHLLPEKSCLKGDTAGIRVPSGYPEDSRLSRSVAGWEWEGHTIRCVKAAAQAVLVPRVSETTAQRPACLVRGCRHAVETSWRKWGGHLSKLSVLCPYPPSSRCSLSAAQNGICFSPFYSPPQVSRDWTLVSDLFWCVLPQALHFLATAPCTGCFCPQCASRVSCCCRQNMEHGDPELTERWVLPRPPGCSFP